MIKVNYYKWKRQAIRTTYFVINHYRINCLIKAFIHGNQVFKRRKISKLASYHLDHWNY